MADTSLQVELVAADRVVWSGQADEVVARTVEGDLGVLVGHAPLLSVLVPGVVKIKAGTETVVAVVEDGFLSVADDRVSILSEDTSLVSELDREQVQAELEQARSADDTDAVLRAEAKLRGIELA
ncbi:MULTISPECIES: F0F1 ATP synthase subunit epsilon [Aeromicrobium]|jgi:F-type H+-transporting ATPase subunit epsilon|uniref:ATP synthase epsilon chain n=1 Tax=Aeromicrobium erythreum TaxID=2041 RepID=A0A0U4B991_9ACTN|nr:MULTISPECIES: F0F1 ATP synthase subunit epsilon [Aeromicrobium]ALX04404.1 ATP synthase subunit epsilon [Aeromicrobium erythreum]MCO7238122.1 F0F1 ATP synthase subunit epsilon [Aeromicrobium sp. CnD17-E]MDR6119976.1 F-type H+-transporting ATPase subunit epsilon [Aeromicrobium sp. SORGH_AS_0981]